MTTSPRTLHLPPMWHRLCIVAAGLLGAGAVAMAAVAAHGLGSLSAAAQVAVHSAVEMQGWHALALLGAASLLPRGGWPARLAALGFAAGTVLFCAGVYGHEIAGWSVAGLAPVGGTTLIVSWLVLAVAGLRRSA